MKNSTLYVYYIDIRSSFGADSPRGNPNSSLQLDTIRNNGIVWAYAQSQTLNLIAN